jgi:hypothetical protein
MPAPIPGSREIVPGLWRWTAYHAEWEEEVGCVAIDAGGELVLIDPLLVDDAAWRALERDDPRVSVVLTIFYHQRSACELLDRRPGTALWAPLDDEAELACTPTRRFGPGETLPGGLEPLATARDGEVVLWHPESGSLIPGDIILGDGRGGLRL